MVSQKNKNRLIALAILIMAVTAIFLDFPGTFKKIGIPLPGFLDVPFRLGLDLQGGTHLIYQADVSNLPESERASAVEGVRDVIERRVNAFGVAEPSIQTTKAGDTWRVIVDLAGVTDVNQAISMIGETPLLEFKEANPNPTITLTPEQQQQLDTFNQEAKTKAEGLLAKVLEPGADFAEIAKTNSEDPGSASNGGDLGFVPRGLFVPEFESVCFDKLKVGETSKELVKSPFGYHIIRKEGENGAGEDYTANCRHIMITTRTEKDFAAGDDEWLYTGLTGTQLKRASVEFDPNTQIPQVLLEFNDEGKNLFAEITKKNIGKPVAIFLDGEAISVPTVQNAITDGRAVISGNFKINEAKLLAQRLNAGALPVPIQLISQQTIGASLGNQSVQKSLNAGIIGLIAVALFMIVYYRLPGITAVLSLLFYAVIILAVFKLVPVTLTLSGIAGFILSLGMAVDANILTFERLREELKDKKILPIAIDEGFKRSWPSIFDGNTSTLITCFILIAFTTSVVKGFAITLAIGIAINLFSATVVTKLILKSVARLKPFGSLWLYGVKK
ncbi:MAG: protein translocase subunit SecD [Candidatus Buchananbacteria bacterium]|nr:protein translocase subunit SecD [Candidatus Buchananbacteria bacterium]